MVQAVLFDIGNVFVHWSPRFLYEKLIDDPAELDWFLSEVVTLDWHTAHDAGRPFAESIAERVRAYPDHGDLIRAFDSRWDETIRGPIPGSVAALESLKAAGVPSYALTNFSAEKWPPFRQSFAFARLFDGVVVSGEEGLVKPDPAIYHRAVTRFRLTPEHTLFVDDRADNIAAAEALGFRAHLFESPDGLHRALEAHGLPAPRR
ncbi:HAD family hydrolase [Yunchengibacter salinarum]|uniref:HAD family hydrolase n=1 Tax=Yunchengibacter salinarum TaxID=3133399 RepID=UPI0035B5E4FE